MPVPGSTAAAGLEASVLRLSRLGFFDFVGDPLRATDAQYDLSFAASGDASLDGDYFALDASLIDVSDVNHANENSSPLTVTLSGFITLDSDMMTLLGNRANWIGREAILWYMVQDEESGQIGLPWRHYTGRMVNVSYQSEGSASSVTIAVENYLASMAEPSNKTYMIQNLYDAGDLSAAASLASSNSKNPLTNTPAINTSTGYDPNNPYVPTWLF